MIVSDYAGFGFSSAVGRRVRARELRRGRSGASAVFARRYLIVWRGRRAQIESSEIIRAETYVRGVDLTLRGREAIRSAIAERLGEMLVTFDRPMASAARTLGRAIAGV